jgi:hypothetical protein
VRPATPHDNLHTLFMNAEALCVRCRGCNTRRVLGRGEGLDIHRDDRRTIHSLKLRCRDCGGRDVERLILLTMDEARAWLSDDAGHAP